MTRVIAAAALAAVVNGCGAAGDAFVEATADAGAKAPDGAALTRASDAPEGGGGSNAGPVAEASAADSQPLKPLGEASAADGTALDGASFSAGQVACGSSSCDIATQFCCVHPDGTGTCETSSAVCTALGGARRACDEAADCPSGQVCCYDFSSLPASAGCHADCGGNGDTRVQACRAQAECLGGTCAVHTCTTGGSIQTCAGFPAECP